MASTKLKMAVGVAVVLLGTLVPLGCGALRAAGANGLLHPGRRVLDTTVREAHPQVTFAGADVTLSGWKFPAQGARRGTVVYLHGIADNRGSGLAPALRLSARGFDVIAYDSRAHGDSTGEICTFGFYEKRDLQRVLDVLASGPVIVIGSSLGGAVALQTAAEDARISGVVAAESFSDLRTVATERAPWFFTGRSIRQALALAETQGRFEVDAVSPMESARRINVPVLLIHGALDRETPPEHSKRIFDSLPGRKRLLLVEGSGHNQSLQPASVWSEIEGWIDSVLGERAVKVSRRQFLNAAGAATAAGAGFYTWRVEPHWLEIVRRPLPVRGLPAALAGRTLAQISDVHVGPRVADDYVLSVFARVAELRPDMVVLTGDLVSHHDRMFEQMEAIYRHFPRGRIATVGILGNHDYGVRWSHPEIADRVVAIAQQSGIVMLRNQVHDVEGLQIAGFDDLWAKRFDPAPALASLDTRRAAIALSHNPDTADFPVWERFEGWILSGHTHGGQCKAPFLPPPLLPVRNRRYTQGVFRLSGNRSMYISRGVGHLIAVRFNVRPEVTLFELRQA